MTTEYLRDALFTAAWFGMMGMAWFGWAQEKPPPRWPARLGAASGVGMLLAVAFGILTGLHWDAPTALAGRFGTFGVVVGVEVALCLAGALTLMWAVRRRDLVATWIGLVVGIHFVPLAFLLDDPSYHLLAALMTAGTLAATWYAKRHTITVSAAVGVVNGALLLVFALRSGVVGLLGL